MDDARGIVKIGLTTTAREQDRQADEEQAKGEQREKAAPPFMFVRSGNRRLLPRPTRLRPRSPLEEIR